MEECGADFLKNKTLWFKDLKTVFRINEKMLNIPAKALEAVGLIRKEVFSSKPLLKVKYSSQPSENFNTGNECHFKMRNTNHEKKKPKKSRSAGVQYSIDNNASEVK